MNRIAAAVLIALLAAAVAPAQTNGPQPPVATALSPDRVVAGSPDTVITITGSGFTNQDQVYYGEAMFPATYVDATHIRFTLPGSFFTWPSFGYIVVMTPDVGYSDSLVFTVTIPFTTPPILPSATVGAPYTQPIAINTEGTASPYSWAVTTGSLPPGLLLNSQTGVLSGTPTAAGVFKFTVAVTDSSGYYYGGVPASARRSRAARGGSRNAFGDNWGDQKFTLTVTPGQIPLEIWFPGTLPDGAVGKSYGENLYARGGDGEYSWSGSGAPPGLTVDSSGLVAGTPTRAGAFVLSVTVTDGAGATASKTYSLTIGGPVIEITTTSPLPEAVVGTAYSQALAVKGGQAPFRWFGNMFPPGLRLDGATGAISGTPTQAGTFRLGVQVTDSAGNRASRDFVLVVTARRLSITTTSPLPAGTEGAVYSTSFGAADGSSPYTWSVSGATGGLALDAASGVLSGTPASAGSYSFTVQVKDSTGATASKAFDLTINRAPVAIVTGSLASGTAAAPYTQQVQASGGVPPYTWSAGGLPSGLAFDAATGVIGGTPAAAGSATVSIQVTDSAGASATKAFTLAVRTPPLPQINLSGAGSADPAQQVTLIGTLGTGYPLRLNGQLTLTFTPDAVSAADDPAIQFATGGRTFDFAVEPNSSKFPDAGLQTGTVAGTIVITLARIEGGGVDMTPSPAPAQTIVVNRKAPTITSVSVVRTSTGFEVQVSGYSTPREVTQARFTFTAAAGSSVQNSDMTVPVGPTFTTWYNDTASRQFGSMFRYVQPFAVQGGVNGLVSVAVTLSNSVGTSQPVTANF